MLDSLKKFFGPAQNHDAGRHDVRVATCAILLEMANIDGEFSDREQREIVSILERRFGLEDSVAADLIAAAHAERERSVDLWGFTNQINQGYTREEKIKILELVWQVLYIDGIVDKHEEYLARKITHLLRLTHEEFIGAKMKMKNTVADGV